MSGLLEYLKDYSSERFPLPSNEKVDLGEKDADIKCNISKCIDIIDDLVNTYEYNVSIENLSILGQIMSTGSKIPPIFPFRILTDTLLNNKTNHTPEEKKKEIMDELFVLKEGDETSRVELVRPIKLNIIDVLFNESFFDDLQKNTKKNYTLEEKKALKSCLKVELEDINNKQIIKFIPEFLSVSLTGANGVITILIKELRDRMKRKLMIHQFINQTTAKKIPDDFNQFQEKAIYDLIIEGFLINLLDIILLDPNIELNEGMLKEYSFHSLPVKEIKTDLMIDFNSFLAMLFDHINFEIMFPQIKHELYDAYVNSEKTQKEKDNIFTMVNTFEKPSYQFSGIDPNLLPRIVSLLNNKEKNALTELNNRFLQILNELITQQNYDLYISCIEESKYREKTSIINCVKKKIMYPLNEKSRSYEEFKDKNSDLIKNLVSYYTSKIKNIDYWNSIETEIGKEKMKIFHLNNPFYNETKSILNKYPIHNMRDPDYYKTITKMRDPDYYEKMREIHDDDDEKELNGGKRKKTFKNRKRKKCRKTNKKQKKKSLGYRKNKGRKTRRK
jgi:hypothetical protein